MKTAVVLVAAIATAALVDARQEFVERIPNAGNVPDVLALGHADSIGISETRNVFGEAFEKAGKKWTKELCQADSDGDGQTNGQELGDPCCEWVTGGTPKWTAGVSNPGDATKTSDAKLWASASCSNAANAPAPATTSDAVSTTATVIGATVTAAAALAQW